MPFVPFPAGSVEALIRFNIEGIPGEITQGYKFVTGAAVYTDGVALAAILHGWVDTGLRTALTPAINFTEIIVNDLTSSSGWQATDILGLPGTAAGPTVENQVAMVVTFQTAKRGRSYRGRNYVAGLPAADLFDTKSWGTAAQTGFQAQYDALALLVAAGGWTPVVLSRFNGGAVRVLGEPTPISNYRGNEKLGTIRGRLT